jgi:polyisoprenoid-binding protein YceI
MTTITESTETRTTGLPVGTWAIDPVHSTAEFRVRNMGIVTVTGQFADFEGTIVSDGTLEGSRAEGTVEVASLSTRSEKRDQHLHTDDFFASEQHPQIHFVSKRFRSGDDGIKVVGDLTIKGTTREVVFDVAPQVDTPIEDPWGSTRVGIEARTEVDRRDYGLNWETNTPAGIPLASYRVKLALDLGLVKQDD